MEIATLRTLVSSESFGAAVPVLLAWLRRGHRGLWNRGRYSALSAPGDVRSQQMMVICTGLESTCVVTKFADDIQDDGLPALPSLYDNCRLLRRDPQTGKSN